MKTKLQGTNTGANFGDEYIKTEAIIEASLHAREKYKAKGVPDFYCTRREEKALEFFLNPERFREGLYRG